ncbi:MAG: biopolymer transporter ExbD [Bacteroidaceae bacterium]|jgi:biopolymer transport protein ExbD|nr:biopolymer transporter ExbD [Bacteroidaceae bacterium]MBQ5705492.1 biopolymer transporter ExbD [Bacteroidaceae bacterium]MBR5511854.1 biopolymer transporter ExbD [Bacteroidaceae bacterium]MBR5849417.1 biopolymer transporter ExbD [Bacteroidaceae bacterium]
MGKRKVPGLNASSTADISFILLIFFLVTTSMDTDRGLAVRLPNPPEENQQDPPKIRERNSMIVNVNMNNQIMVTIAKEPREIQVSELRELAKEFIANPEDKADLPEKVAVELPAPFGVQMITKNHVISLQTDRATSYDTYFQVENELYGAYNDLRDELARKTFGRPYRECTEDEQLACRQYYKCVISEAEPRKYNQ